VMVPGIMQVFGGQLAGGLAALGLPAAQVANVAAALRGLQPNATQVRGVLRNLPRRLKSRSSPGPTRSISAR